ncbi:MAG: DUF4389 domain-containing protein [Dehalococcoidia bacterium]|nr:DUF4389 domain-containing protein [Dehalococcoidia bacterium]
MSADYTMSGGGYPVGIEIDGPQPQNRLSVLLRFLYVIPHALVLAILAYAIGVTTFIAWLIIVVTGKCPAGLAKFHAGYLRWSTRMGGYMFLLTDKYPAFSMDADNAYPIRVSIQDQLENRNRLTVLLRLIMVIPHVIALSVVGIVAEVLLFVAWLVALFTGSVPEGIHTFLAGFMRWYNRVGAYAILLTDEYPPFSMS